MKTFEFTIHKYNNDTKKMIVVSHTIYSAIAYVVDQDDFREGDAIINILNLNNNVHLDV